MRLILLLGVAAFLVGCRTHSTRTADQFAFLEVGMPMTVVSNRVGLPDLPYRGQIRWRYSLADGSEMAIVAEPRESLTRLKRGESSGSVSREMVSGCGLSLPTPHRPLTSLSGCKHGRSRAGSLGR